VEKILEGNNRGLDGDAVLSFGCVTEANYEQDKQRTGDGQNNGNTWQYRNKSVCVGCTERILVVSVFRCSLVSLHCLVPVLMHYSKFLSNSSYESTAEREKV
jgi:hypothetical protein